jgi:serine O-acetyltransferase
LLRLFLEPIHLFLSHRVRSKWGIDIAISAEIGPGFYIGHFGGIIIGGRARIGRDVNISQLVTIGASGRGDKEEVPTIGDGVYIAPGAKLYGKIRIGNNVKIGPNTVIYRDVPDNAVVAPVPFVTLTYLGNVR